MKKGIKVTYYFKEFGNDRHTALWTFILPMLIQDHISYQPQRRFNVIKKQRRNRNIVRPVWTMKTFHSFSMPLTVVCKDIEFLRRILVRNYSCISRMGQA
eukprot:scaffold49569_cov49-Attheya_sp.AAC.3